MGVARGQRARLIGPLPSAFWGVVLLGGGSLPWWHAVPEIDQTLQERTVVIAMQGTKEREG